MYLNEQEKYLIVRDLTIQFRQKGKKVKAVKNVSFDIYKGEIFSIVGESGSGKTTISRAIAGIQGIKNGTIYLNNRVIRGNPPNLYKLNRLINTGLDNLKNSRNITNRELARYVNNLKSYYFKYFENAKYDPESNELSIFEDKDYKIQSVSDLERYDIKSFKNNHKALDAIKKDYIANMKIVKRIIKQFQVITTFTTDLHQYIEQLPFELENGICQLVNENIQIAQEIMVLANKCYKLISEFEYKIDKFLVDLTSIAEAQEKIDDLFLHLNNIIIAHKEYSEKLLLLRARQKEILPIYLPNSSKTRKTIKQSYQSREDKYVTKYIDNKLFKELINYPAIDTIVSNSEVFRIPSRKEKRNNKKQIQMVFQDPYASLNDRVSVEEIIAEGLNSFPEIYKNDKTRKLYLDYLNNNVEDSSKGKKEYKLEDIKDNEVKRFLITNIIKEVGLLPEHLSRYSHEFSGGQRQRIGIARVLVMNPSLVIADEPISALDVSIRAQVMNLLKKFQEQHQLTYIFVAHDLSVVRYISDRIAVFYQGQLVELAPADELFENPLHPYTKALLSAIPLPNPNLEKEKQHFIYDPKTEHYDYVYDLPEFVEVANGHYLFGNTREIQNALEKISK